MESEVLWLQFRHRGSAPSIDDICRMFNLTPEEINPAANPEGIIAIDRTQGIYSVFVAADGRERVQAVLATRGDPVEYIGFANVRIEPTGPPER